MVTSFVNISVFFGFLEVHIYLHPILENYFSLQSFLVSILFYSSFITLSICGWWGVTFGCIVFQPLVSFYFDPFPFHFNYYYYFFNFFKNMYIFNLLLAENSFTEKNIRWFSLSKHTWIGEIFEDGLPNTIMKMVARMTTQDNTRIPMC